METARAWSVPHSVLTGRVVGDGEPLFTARDAALAVALMRLESLQCSGCGQDRRESLSPDSEGTWRAEAIRCHACATRERAAETFNKDGPQPGLMFTVQQKGGGGRG